jgi:hypothetical protein
MLMKNLRSFLVVGFMTAAINSSAGAQVPETTSPPPTGAHDFDFLVGEWRVHHHRLKPDSQEWVDFEGTCSNRKLMDGGANMEEHALNAPYGAYRAVALRAYDPKTGQCDLVARRALPFRSSRPTSQGAFRERRRHLLWQYDGQQKADTRAFRVVANHRQLRSLGTSVFI